MHIILVKKKNQLSKGIGQFQARSGDKARFGEYTDPLKNVPYCKIMVVSKFGAWFTIGRFVNSGFCYVFCFIRIIQCCVACS